MRRHECLNATRTLRLCSFLFFVFSAVTLLLVVASTPRAHPHFTIPSFPPPLLINRKGQPARPYLRRLLPLIFLEGLSPTCANYVCLSFLSMQESTALAFDPFCRGGLLKVTLCRLCTYFTFSTMIKALIFSPPVSLPGKPVQVTFRRFFLFCSWFSAANSLPPFPSPVITRKSFFLSPLRC